MNSFRHELADSGTNVTIKRRAPDQVRGRAMSLFVMAFNGVAALGSLDIGLLADRIGAGKALAFAGTACILQVVVSRLPRASLTR